MWNDATLVIIICEWYCIVLFIRRTETMSIQAVYFHDFVSTTYIIICVVRIHIIIILHHSKCNTYKLLSSNNIIYDFMRLDASIQGLHSFFSLGTYVVHIIIILHASLQRLFKPYIIIIGYVCVDHNKNYYYNYFRDVSSTSRIFGYFCSIFARSPYYIADHIQIISVGKLMLRLSAEYSVSICVLIMTSPTIYFSIKMRSMAETYGHLLPLVLTTCLRRPVVSATVCFVSVANSEFPRINDFSGHKIFMKIVH